MIRFNQKGDTIVEVLIAIAIIGAVLAGAYRSANSSLQANRRAQERAEAVRVAEKQLERLKSSSDNGVAINAGAVNFCLSDAGAKTDFATAPPTDYNGDPLSSEPSGIYPVACATTFTGAYNYFAWIERQALDTYDVRVRWEGLGVPRQQVEIIYRVHNS